MNFNLLYALMAATRQRVARDTGMLLFVVEAHSYSIIFLRPQHQHHDRRNEAVECSSPVQSKNPEQSWS